MLSPESEAVFQSFRRRAQILGIALCYGVLVPYLAIWAMVVFQGDLPTLMAALRGNPPVPWGHPVVQALALLAGSQVAGAFLLRSRFLAQAKAERTLPGALQRLTSGHVVLCALLEAVAIYGLVLAFVAGPGTAPLTLLLMAVPPMAYPLVVPGEEAWQAVADEVATRSDLG